MNAMPQLVIFDLDGTLTIPAIDFDRLRAEIGILRKVTILEELERMSPAQRHRAMVIIEQHEKVAAKGASLQPGVHELLDYLRKHGIFIAIATRNSRRSAHTVLQSHRLAVDRVHAREDGPVKPSPDPVLTLCRHFGVSPLGTWLVGDYLYDIQSGEAAGATTVLVVGEREIPEYSALSDYVIGELADLKTLLMNSAH